MGRWNAFKLINDTKTILCIIYYRIPTISSKGIHSNKAQINCKVKEVKSNTKLREEILNDLSVYIKSQKATDVILASNLNKSMCAKAVKRFYIENGLFDTHTYANEIND